MKNNIIALLGLSLCAPAFVAHAQEPAEAPATVAAPPAAKLSETEVKAVVSYFIGFQTGIQLRELGDGPVYIDDIDRDAFFRALTDGLKGQLDPNFDEPEKIRPFVESYIQTLTERGKALSESNLAQGKAFLEENAKKEGVTTTESGLQYKVLTPADGRKYDADKDGSNALASITYEGRLIDGTVFDKSTKPIDMPIKAVVPGFSEALQLMPIGSEWEIYIPADLAYGADAPGPIGPNSTLIFKLKLHNITPRGTAENPMQLTPEMLQQLQESGLQPM